MYMCKIYMHPYNIMYMYVFVDSMWLYGCVYASLFVCMCLCVCVCVCERERERETLQVEKESRSFFVAIISITLLVAILSHGLN